MKIVKYITLCGCIKREEVEEYPTDNTIKIVIGDATPSDFGEQNPIYRVFERTDKQMDDFKNIVLVYEEVGVKHD